MTGKPASRFAPFSTVGECHLSVAVASGLAGYLLSRQHREPDRRRDDAGAVINFVSAIFGESAATQAGGRGAVKHIPPSGFRHEYPGASGVARIREIDEPPLIGLPP